jgi:large subunit ribosomal protein L18
MRQEQKKIVRRLRRKRHIRRKVFGTAAKPRLTVFRSHQNIYCQLIDDSRGVTLVSASTLSKDLKGESGQKGGNRAASVLVGKQIAEKARGLGISAIAFDRNGYRFHGRIKALADAAREAGLKF